MMDVQVLDTPRDVAVAAADAVEALVRAQPEAVLGLATGSTPLGTYDELAERHAEDDLSFARARGFLLDEYIGLPPDHPERYRNVIVRELAARVGMPQENVRAPHVDEADLDEACAEYERELAQVGGVDLQILGLGSDGHIAFNMPGSDVASRTRVTTLTEQTVLDNARFFDGDPARVPRQVVTQGLATIMTARRILLLVTGERKAPAVRDLLEGPVGEAVPATALHAHPRTTVLMDREAASLLRGASSRRTAHG